MVTPLLALPAAGWLFVASRNKGARLVAYTIAFAWVYDSVISDEEDEFTPAQLLVAAGAAYAFIEVVN